MSDRKSIKHMQGAVSIEFALTFGLFFALLYAIVSYALVFMLVQGFTSAAEDGLRAGISVDCSGLSTTNCINSHIIPTVRQQAVTSLSWMPANVRSAVLGTNGNLVEVTCDSTNCEAVIRYSNYATTGLTPVITLPVIGAVPRLPQDLVGRGSLRL